MVDTNRRTAELNQALELLHFAFRAITEGPDRLLARHGMTRVHHRILYFVARHPEGTVGDLLSHLGVTKQALHRPLQQLIAGGWVAARAAPGDRRQRLLRLTDSGAELEERLSGEQRDRFARAFAATGPQAERAWREVMSHLAGRAGSGPGAGLL